MVQSTICFFAAIPAALVHSLYFLVSTSWALVLLSTRDRDERVNLHRSKISKEVLVAGAFGIPVLVAAGAVVLDDQLVGVVGTGACRVVVGTRDTSRGEAAACTAAEEGIDACLALGHMASKVGMWDSVEQSRDL